MSQVRNPTTTADRSSRGTHTATPELQDTTLRSAVEAWAADSGMTVPDFEHTYFEQCVGDLLDQHPAVRRVDAERLVLNEVPWLTESAA
jgi:hypothetical protein